MIKENRVSKYVLYAIGEIILVVIGILIALQINNWNDYKKSRKEEFRLLEKFQSDFSSDSLSLANCIERELTVLGRIDTLYRLINKGNDDDMYTFLSKSNVIGFTTDFKPNSGTFDEAVSTGKMELIENDKLRERLFNYYREVIGTNTEEISILYQHNQIVPDYFATIGQSGQFIRSVGNIGTKVPDITFEQLSTDPIFNRMLVWRKINANFQIDFWKEIISKSDSLKTSLTTEIRLKRND